MFVDEDSGVSVVLFSIKEDSIIFTGKIPLPMVSITTQRTKTVIILVTIPALTCACNYTNVTIEFLFIKN
jgi:hypothetical protein